MAKRKKVILFIVEGITDKTCLGFALSKILNSNIVEFQLINGDITCETGINSSNIAEKVGRIVKEFSDPFSFKACDFLEIVHLVDMDGAYVADNQIVQRTPETPVDPSDRKKLYYGDNQIFVNNIVSIQKRNQQKTSIINRLISMKKVWRTIPYSVYFFSCNLDHVIHGERNLFKNDKSTYADAYTAKFENGDSFKQFIDFFHAPDIAAPGNYDETWTFIKADNNSLKRYTNFQLFFSNPKNSRE